jgi:hypothetical protein
MQRTIPIHIPPPLRHSDIWHLPNGFRPGLHPCPPQTREPVATRSGGRFRFVPCLVPPPGPEICSLARPGLSCPFPLPWYPAIVKAAGSGDGAEEKGRQKQARCHCPAEAYIRPVPHISPSPPRHHRCTREAGLYRTPWLSRLDWLLHTSAWTSRTPPDTSSTHSTHARTQSVHHQSRSPSHTHPLGVVLIFFFCACSVCSTDSPFCSYRSAGSSRRNSSSSSST